MIGVGCREFVQGENECRFGKKEDRKSVLLFVDGQEIEVGEEAK